MALNLHEDGIVLSKHGLGVCHPDSCHGRVSGINKICIS